MGWLSDTWDTVKENASDICHGVLDAAGFIPVVGAIPDVINGCIYAAEGNALDAGMSFAAAIPGVGDIGAVVGKGGKYLLKGGKWLLGKGKKLLKGTGNLLKALKKSRFLGKLAKLGGKLLGKMKVGAKALRSKGKKLLDKIAEKFKKKCKNGHCFVEGTLVWTEQGLQEIETIPSGSLIYARNEETGEVGLKRVKRTLGGKAHTIYTIGMGDHGIIQSTNYHRYYVEEKGWVSAIQLQVGDYLCTIEGEHVEITSIEKERQEEGVAVYNFVVEDWESYFVSEVGVYVHNDPCDPKKGGKETELFLPDEYYSNLNKNIQYGYQSPNTRQTYTRLGNTSHEIETSVVISDDFGRIKYRIDYSTHGNDLAHTNPHIHEFVGNTTKGDYQIQEFRYFIDESTGKMRLGKANNDGTYNWLD